MYQNNLNNSTMVKKNLIGFNKDLKAECYIHKKTLILSYQGFALVSGLGVSLS
jgi:hypothetical protein